MDPSLKAATTPQHRLKLITGWAGFACFLIPLPAMAGGTGEPPARLDLTHHWAGYLSVIIMITSYVVAMLEDVTHLRKSKPMLLAAGLIWFFIALIYQLQGIGPVAVHEFKGNLLAYISNCCCLSWSS